jgi:SAM-dependent methyltransferase
MSHERGLYGTLAPYYDYIYHWKDYSKEADKVRELVRRYKRSHGNSLLDVACGTGTHLSYLRRRFECVGLDKSLEMLAIASRKVEGVRFEVGDMVEFDLGRRFDVVTCLFSGIAYLKSRRQVREAIANFSRHLNAGGLLIIEPWVTRSGWRDGNVDLQRYESAELKIARIVFGRARGNFSVLDDRYIIGEKGKGISYVKTKHVMRFFELEETLEAMRGSGLSARFLKESLTDERGLLIGVKEEAIRSSSAASS